MSVKVGVVRRVVVLFKRVYIVFALLSVLSTAFASFASLAVELWSVVFARFSVNVSFRP